MSDKSAVMNVRQSAELDFALERNGWTADDVKKLSTGDMLAKILPFVRGQAEIVLFDQIIPMADILKIDRTKPFNPEDLVGKDYRVWRGPKNGNGLEGGKEEDERSLVIAEINPTNILALTGLREGESSLTGEERLARLIIESIQLDAKIGETLYREKGQKTLRWLHQTFGVSDFEFLGTTLRRYNGNRCALRLWRHDDGCSWHWNCNPLDYARSSTFPALCLPIS